MTTTTPHVDQVGGEAATAQQEAVDRRRGSRPNRPAGKSVSKADSKPTADVKPDTMTVSLTFDELLAISTVLVAASTDDVTPVITSVRLRQTADRVDAVATDRYRVAMVDFPRRDASRSEFTVLLSRDLLSKAISVGKIGGDHKEMQELPTITLTVEDIAGHKHTTLESMRGWRFSEDEISGMFPPVEKLFPAEGKTSATLAGTALNMKYVADAAKVRVPGQVNPAQTDNIWQVEQAESDSPNKPGPVLFTQTSSTGRARYLLQPNLITR